MVAANVVVAPVTTTLRAIPSCVPVGPDEGLDREGVATSDNLAAVPRSVLTIHLGHLGPAGRAQMCEALRALADR